MDILSCIRNAPPDNIAIEHGTSNITYYDLIAKADILAEKYILENIGPGRAVGVELQRSIECVVAWIAAWIVNAPFVAIDPTLPEFRKEKYRRFCYRLFDKGHNSHRGNEVEKRVAYVFFSSGSTGTPKAILMPRTGLRSVIKSQIETFSMDKSSRVLWMLSPGFDASLSDVFTALCSGATLVIADTFSDVQTFLKFLYDASITHMDIPPSLLSRLQIEDLPKTLKTIIVGGEVCTLAVIRKFAGPFRLVNCYGPTETTICASMKVFKTDDDPSNIGTPNKGFRYLLQGEELWIHSPGIAISYGDNIQSDRFMVHEGRPWFRTGDRVEKRDEEYYFLGRIDRQFKMNGQLVNPEEVEKCLLSTQAILECRVEKQDGKLLAFCVTNTEFKLARVLDIVCLELPAWMIPRIVLVDVIPRNERGKIEADAFIKKTKSERALQNWKCVFQETMSEMLGYDVDEHDDFWKVGGDSLLAFDFIQALSKKGYQLHIETLRKANSPAKLRCFGVPKKITSKSVFEDFKKFPKHIFPRTKERVRTVLLTGSTGFLGRRVLNLLVESGHEVFCIVRGKDDEGAQRRIGKKKNTEVYAGDLLLPNWGLSQDRFQALADRCDTVIHLAADLNLSKSYDPESVYQLYRQMARFFENGIEKSMVFASTLSVFASTDFQGIAREDNFNFDGVDEIYGGYTAEKMLAETIVRNCFLDATIIRFGLLTGDSQSGAFHEQNVLVSLIRSIFELKTCVRSESWCFDLTPVDHAAHALITLLSNQGTFHIANSDPPSLDTLISAMEKYGETNLKSLTHEDFLAELDVLGGADAQLARVGAARLNSNRTYDILRSGDLFLASDIDFNGMETQRWLESQGCKRNMSNEVLLEKYIRWSLGQKSVKEKS